MREDGRTGSTAGPGPKAVTVDSLSLCARRTGPARAKVRAPRPGEGWSRPPSSCVARQPEHHEDPMIGRPSRRARWCRTLAAHRDSGSDCSSFSTSRGSLISQYAKRFINRVPVAMRYEASSQACASVAARMIARALATAHPNTSICRQRVVRDSLWNSGAEMSIKRNILWHSGPCHCHSLARSIVKTNVWYI